MLLERCNLKCLLPSCLGLSKIQAVLSHALAMLCLLEEPVERVDGRVLPVNVVVVNEA